MNAAPELVPELVPEPLKGVRGMLVAAGFGTRLDPLTRELPKPAVPVGNRPIAAYALEHLARAGVREIVVNTHHLEGALRAALDPHCPPEVALRYVHEPAILGTGGGVRNAWAAIGAASGGPAAGEDFLAFNAKLLFAPDLARAVAAHRESGAIATLVLRALPENSRFSAVEHDREGRVWRIRGLPQAPAIARPANLLAPAMFTGVQILSPRALADLPREGDVFEHAYLPWLARGEHVHSVLDDSPFRDVGVSLRHYLEANLEVAASEGAGENLIARGVHVPASASLQQVVLGAGVRVPEHAALARVVAWEGARLPATLNDAIVTSAGVIAQG